MEEESSQLMDCCVLSSTFGVPLYTGGGGNLTPPQGTQEGVRGEEAGGQRGEASPRAPQTLTAGFPRRMGPLGPVKGDDQ
jgi:hypothetical protein